MKKLIISIVAVISISLNAVHAADWLNWSNFSKVTGIVQSGPVMWIAGHGGVMTIDTGTLQKTYYIKTAGQLPSLMVEDIQLSAATGDIWIGTYDNGLVQVHNGNWTTHSFPTSLNFYHMAIDDASGTVWCATSNGLYKFANNTFSRDSNSLTQFAWDVKIFPNGKLLLASIFPIIFDPATDSAREVHTTVATYSTSYICIENDSSFFFTAQAQGISHMVDTTEYYITDSLVLDNDSDQIIQMKVLNSSLTVLTMNSKSYQYNGGAWAPDAYNSDAQAIAATFLYQDVNANLWLGGANNGGVVRPLNGGPDIVLKKFALISNLVSAIHDKSSTELWVMAGNQIGVYDKVSNTFSQVYELPIAVYNNTFNVGDIAIWNGTPIALTDSGLYQFTGGAWSILNIPGMVNSTYILCLATDTSGDLYAGTLNGVYVVNGTNVTAFTSSNTTAFASNDVIGHAYFDVGRNTMWFGMSNGIVRFSNGTFTLINGSNYPQLLNYSYVGSIAQDPSGNMWFGTAYGGLVKYDGTIYTTDSVGESAGNQTVTAIAFDGATMYAADNVFGLWVRNSGSWTNYSYANSNMTSTYPKGLYVDPNHDVWINYLDYGNIEAFGIDIFNQTEIALSITPPPSTSPVSVYPNPTSDKLYIGAGSPDIGAEVSITDIEGKNCGLYPVTDHSIDISGLSPGVYIMHSPSMSPVKIIKE